MRERSYSQQIDRGGHELAGGLEGEGKETRGEESGDSPLKLFLSLCSNKAKKNIFRRIFVNTQDRGEMIKRRKDCDLGFFFKKEERERTVRRSVGEAGLGMSMKLERKKSNEEGRRNRSRKGIITKREILVNYFSGGSSFALFKTAWL